MFNTTVSIPRDGPDATCEVEVSFHTPDEYEVADEDTAGRTLTASEWDRATMAAPEAIQDWFIDRAEMMADARRERE